MIIKYLLLGILFYFIYKFVFGFIIPVYKTTKQVKKQFSDMKQKVQDQFGTFNNEETSPSKEVPKTKVDKDYIDFEDVKYS